jgi:RNase P/RNase MRP subunit p29
MLKKLIMTGVLTAALWTLPVHAAAPKTYQVTGPVLELTADTIVVQKGKDRWEIARDATTKVSGDLKVGAKVTIDYRMSAAAVEVKPEKAAGKAKSKTKG